MMKVTDEQGQTEILEKEIEYNRNLNYEEELNRFFFRSASNFLSSFGEMKINVFLILNELA